MELTTKLHPAIDTILLDMAQDSARAAILLVVFLLALPFIIFMPKEPRPHFTGNFGSDDTMKTYDQMTQKEHDQAGAFWGGG